MGPRPESVTELLQAWGQGDAEAGERLVPLVYGDLRRRAARYLRKEAAGHTLQPTALVHEAYLRLIDQKRVDWSNRAQFLGLAAAMMRRILLNHARDLVAGKRGGGAHRVTLGTIPRHRRQEELACFTARVHRCSCANVERAPKGRWAIARPAGPGGGAKARRMKP